MGNESPPPAEPTVTEANGFWIVDVERQGKVQRYRCATEAQARRLAGLMRAPGPVRRPGR